MMIMNAPTKQGHKVVFRCGKELIIPINSKDLKGFKLGKNYVLKMDHKKKFVFKLEEKDGGSI